jgi:hypothetical protein
LLLLLILFSVLTNIAAAEDNSEETFQKSCRTPSCTHPLVNDAGLDVKLLYQIDLKFEPNQLSPVSTMTFLGKDTLILNKNNGTIYRINNGTMQNTPLLDVNVANKRERGLLGIVSSKVNSSVEKFFLVFYRDYT